VSRQEGPRFAVTTWRELREPHGLLWFARVVPVRAEAAPFTEAQDEAQAVVEGRRRLPEAVAAAVRRFVGQGGGGVGGSG